MSADHPHDDAGLARVRPFDGDRFQRAVAELLAAAGFDVDPTHLGATPQHVAALWQLRLLDGYDADLAGIIGPGFADPRQDLVVIRDIAVHGMCPHHLVPWRGVAHVAYLPGGVMHGFGQIARLVDALGHRLSYQEWFTRDVAEALVRHGKALGAACVVTAEQMCLLLGENRRGDERVTTTAYAGRFATEPTLRTELMAALQVR